MKWNVKRVGALALACGMLGATVVSADTLVLKDGRELTGVVQPTKTGYTISTIGGVVTLTRAEVILWRQTSAGTPPPSNAPTATKPPANTPPASTPPTSVPPASASPAPAAPAPTAPSSASSPSLAKPGSATPAPAFVPATGLPLAKPANAAEKAKKTAEILVVQGQEALAAGDIKAARDCFVDVLQVELKNRKSLEGLGYCYLKMDDIPRATRSLEGALAIPEPINRPLAMNLALSLLRMRNTMRASKILRDYLVTQPAADEEALNAFAICLAQSSDEAKLNRLFQDMIKFYDEQNAKLEATRPGQKRWGLQWISRRAWEDKDFIRAALQRRLDAKGAELSTARAEYATAKKRYDIAYSNNRFRKTNDDLNGLANEMKFRAGRVDKYQNEWNDINAQFERPTLPKLFAAVPLDETSGSLASAGSTAAGMGSSPGGSGSAPSRGVGSPGGLTPGAGQEVATNTPPKLSTPKPVSDSSPSSPPVAAPAPSAPSLAAPTPTYTPKPSGSRTVFTYATGFAVSADLMVTTADCVDGASRINVQPASGEMLDAEVVKVDGVSGLALIRIKGAHMPYVGMGSAFAGGAIQCPGFPVASLFDPECEIIAGSAAAPKEKWTVRLARHPRLAGAPIISNNAVVGVEVASRDNEATLLPSVGLQQLQTFLSGTPLPAAPGSVDLKAITGVVSAMRNR